MKTSYIIKYMKNFKFKQFVLIFNFMALFVSALSFASSDGEYQSLKKKEASEGLNPEEKQRLIQHVVSQQEMNAPGPKKPAKRSVKPSDHLRVPTRKSSGWN